MSGGTRAEPLAEVGFPERVIFRVDEARRRRGWVFIGECERLAQPIAPHGVVGRVDDAVLVVVAGQGIWVGYNLVRTEDIWIVGRGGIARDVSEGDFVEAHLAEAADVDATAVTTARRAGPAIATGSAQRDIYRHRAVVKCGGSGRGVESASIGVAAATAARGGVTTASALGLVVADRAVVQK
jgi:hypothetical protein